MLGRYDEKQIIERIAELDGVFTLIVKRHKDGSFDGTVKMVAKAHEVPDKVKAAAEVILEWTGAVSVLVIGNQNGVDRLEWPRRL